MTDTVVNVPTRPLPPHSPRQLAPWILPLGVLCVAYGLLGLTFTAALSHQEIMQRCVLVDPNNARLWSVGNVELGLAYLGVFGGMIFYFLRTHLRSRQHLNDFGLALAYLLGSFVLDYICVQTLQPFKALLIGDAAVITFTALVSRQLWFQRLLGVFVPLVFLTCGVGHLLEGLSYWKLTYPVNVPWTMVTADIGFAILLNGSRFPAFIRGYDMVEELAAERVRAEALQTQIDALHKEESLRRKAEEASAESEERYHTLFETIPIGVVYHAPSGNILSANPAALRLLGLTLDELKGQAPTDPPWRAVCEDGRDLPAAEFPIVRALQTGRPVLDVVMGVYNPQMEEMRWLRVNATPEFHPGSALPYRAYATFEDITRKRQALIQLEESQHQLVLAQQVAQVGSWNWDLTTFNNSCSDELRRLFGREREGWSPSTSAILDALHPDDRSAIAQAMASLVAEANALDNEARVLLPDGTTRLVHMRAESVEGDTRRFRHIIGVVQDITAQRAEEMARQASEENYRLLFENAQEGVFQTTPDGRFRRANPALARLLGYESADQLIHDTTDVGTQIYVEAEHRAEFIRQMRQFEAMTGIEAARDFETQLRRRDGSTVWVSIHARTVRDRAGRVLYYEGFIEDISTRKALEAEKERRLTEALERAERDPLTGLLNHRAFHKRLEEETERVQRDGSHLAVVMLDLDNFKFFNDVYGHTVGDEVLRKVADRLRDTSRSYDVVARFGGDEFALLLVGIGPTPAIEVEARLRESLGNLTYHPVESADTIPVRVSLGVSVISRETAELEHGRQAALEDADERLRFTKTGGGVEAQAQQVRTSARDHVAGFSMLDALVTAVDNKDRYTRRHSEDVMVYSLMIAQEFGMDEAMQRTIAVAALLHDVGKIGVPDAILRKPGKLTDEEFEAIKQHPQMGAVIVQAVPELEATLDAVRHHHERWDGQGYPDGLQGAETPLMARLMAVADAFSAMTTDRPYRKGMTPAKALSIIEAGAGTQWDPTCVEAFIRAQKARELF